MSSITIGDRIIDTERTPLLIAGPCALEDMDDALLIAARCRDEAQRHGFAYVFKSSYLKDNRSSVESYTGPGLERGLEMLERVGREVGVPLLTDVHCREEIGPVAGVCDVIQIPAFLVRQTRLVVAAAETGRAVNLKKGQFLSPEEMGLAVAKARAGGASEVIVTERGTMFGYHNLVVDFTGFERMRPFGAPVVFDATHSLQLPGELGDRSGGRPGLARLLARAAAAAGCDGLFVETHPRPLACRCDAEAMLPLADLPVLLAEAARFFEAAGACRAGGGEGTA